MKLTIEASLTVNEMDAIADALGIVVHPGTHWPEMQRRLLARKALRTRLTETAQDFVSNALAFKEALRGSQARQEVQPEAVSDADAGSARRAG